MEPSAASGFAISEIGLTVEFAISDRTSIKLIIPAAAAKSLAAMPRRERDGLVAKIEAFAADPFAPNPSARPLVGRSDVVRLRQGDFRAVCRIDRGAQTVILDAIGHRKEVYR